MIQKIKSFLTKECITIILVLPKLHIFTINMAIFLHSCDSRHQENNHVVMQRSIIRVNDQNTVFMTSIYYKNTKRRKVTHFYHQKVKSWKGSRRGH